MKMLTDEELRQLLIEAWRDGLDQAVCVTNAMLIDHDVDLTKHSIASFNRCCEFVNNQLKKV